MAGLIAKRSDVMKFLSSPRALNQVLLLDAMASGATALLLLAGAELLAGLFGLPAPFLRAAGLILAPYVLIVGWMARRSTPHATVIWAIICANLLWFGASLCCLLGPWFEPTTLGTAFVIAQAIVVAGFAELQIMAIRRRNLAAPRLA